MSYAVVTEWAVSVVTSSPAPDGRVAWVSLTQLTHQMKLFLLPEGAHLALTAQVWCKCLSLMIQIYGDRQMPNCCLHIWRESSVIVFPILILNLLLPPERAFYWAQSADSVKRWIEMDCQSTPCQWNCKAPSWFLQKVFHGSFSSIMICERETHFAVPIQGKLCWTRRWQSATCTHHPHSAAYRRLSTYCRVRQQNQPGAFAMVKMPLSNFHEVSETSN